ncbi:MAG: autotransporter outer membrane beta-barrel domain-containing protein [Deltaproteobacteria bacterium]|nr:autotransporter outer membrane beta-barrel domain-containing protein [Deltaproteobacteria bacterium]
MVSLLLFWATTAGAETLNYEGPSSLEVNPFGPIWESILNAGNLGFYTAGSPDSLVPHDSSANQVTVDGLTGSGMLFIYGGINDDGDVSDNTVNITDSDSFLVIGGLTTSGDAFNNTVILGDGGLATYGVIGGLTMSGDSYGNKIIFKEADAQADALGAGHTLDGSAYNNTVEMSDGIITGSGVTGGSSTNGEVYDNTVTITGGSMPGPPVSPEPGMIAAGMSELHGEVYNNTLNIFGGELGTTNPILVAAGVSFSSSVRNNVTNITGGEVIGGEAFEMVGVYGGFTLTGDVTGNVLNIKGGYAEGDMSAGLTFDGTASGNYFNISGGELSGGYIAGVNVGVDMTIFMSSGGTSIVATTAGDAFDNHLTISGGHLTAANMVGGNTFFAGSAYRNTVHITGGEIEHDPSSFAVIAGGFAFRDAYENEVIISGGKLTGSGSMGIVIYGGGSNNADTQNINNTVQISGNTLFGTVSIYGGYFYDFSSYPGFGPLMTTVFTPTPDLDLFTGNTLKVWNYAGEKITEIANFQNYDFVLPGSLKNGEVALSVGSIAFGNGSNADSVVSALNIDGGGSALNINDKVVLIRSDSPINTAANNTITYDPVIHGRKGALVDYEFELAIDGADLVARVADAAVNPQSKALPEAFMAGLALVNQANDVLAGEGLSQAVSSAMAGVGGFSGFAATSGSHSRFKTGSHVDLDSFSLLIGLSKALALSSNHLVIGAFIEAGLGEYDSYNDFANAPTVRGEGDTKYLGGGLLARYEFAESSSGKAYVEASARFGKIDIDFSSRDLSANIGGLASYEFDTPYYGIHLGGGYDFAVNDRVNLDLYGKYFWTRQEGDSVVTSNHDRVVFNDVDSHRIRVGGRLSYKVSELIHPYFGLAYDHEFDAKATSSVYGLAIPAPKLEGGTGIGELGLEIRPANGKAAFGFGVQGYLGKREGVSGSLELKILF